MRRAFCYGKELLYHREEKIELGGEDFIAHVFFNEKASIKCKHDILTHVMSIEDKLAELFKTEEEANIYLQDNIITRYRKYFKMEGDKESVKLVRAESMILHDSIKTGSFIMLLNGEDKVSPEVIIEMYRSRDSAEKDIDVFKNQLEGKRIISHNSKTALGRLFVKYLSMILHAKITSVMRSKKDLKDYTVRELLYELRKIKVNIFNKGSEFITEVSKKQRAILEAFRITIPKTL